MKENKFKRVMNSLDAYRAGRAKTIVITKDQKEFLIACRDNPVPITWDKIGELWQELGWGDISSTSLSRRYKMVKAK